MHYDIIELYPESPRRGEELSITYRGLLAQNGADAIWLHYGYDNWQNTSTLGMKRQGNSFSCKINAEGRKMVNFCFKDSADHWDNNNGMNWSCMIR